MRPPKVETETLLARLMDVLKSKGYEGASLNDLAKASGLQKASLYHRFPGGKKEIVLAVLAYADEWMDQHVIGIMNDRLKNPKIRLKEALENTREFYEDGEAICIIRALGLGSGMEIFGQQLRSVVEKWIGSFVAVALDSGFDPINADKIAMNALIKIQGSLVVAKALDSQKPFLEAMKEIEKDFSIK